MPLYYFHIRNGSALERDPEGMELPDLQSAHAEALVASRELAEAAPEFDKDTLIEIADETGRTVLRISFADAAGSIH